MDLDQEKKFVVKAARLIEITATPVLNGELIGELGMNPSKAEYDIESTFNGLRKIKVILSEHYANPEFSHSKDIVKAVKAMDSSMNKMLEAVLLLKEGGKLNIVKFTTELKDEHKNLQAKLQLIGELSYQIANKK